jgi:hypothetical protein
MNEKFPVVFDTKYIVKYSDARKLFAGKSTVEGCFHMIASHNLGVSLVMDDGFDRYSIGLVEQDKQTDGESTEKVKPKTFYHEAGYDAYCTGHIFIASLNSLSFPKPISETIHDLAPIKDHSNKIFLVNHSIPFYDLSNDTHDNMFIISNIKDDLKAHELKNLIQQNEDFGGLDVQWHARRKTMELQSISDEPTNEKLKSCYVIVRNRSKVADFVQKVRNMKEFMLTDVFGKSFKSASEDNAEVIDGDTKDSKRTQEDLEEQAVEPITKKRKIINKILRKSANKP